ncbi:MAG: hypothetical protein ACQSGP_03055 [Frankia sp.]
MRVVSLYVRVLLWTGVPSGVAAGLVSGDLWTGLVVAVVPSAILGTVALLLQTDLGGEQSVRVKAEPAVVRQRALEALRALSARIETTDEVDCIDARTGMSWQSWGERITVDVHPASDGTDVRVRSTPKFKSMPYNYGSKDHRNVEYLVNAVNGDTAGRIDQADPS